jgi:hypothetical protein
MAQLANPGCVKVKIGLSFTSTTSARIGDGGLGSSDLVMGVTYSAPLLWQWAKKRFTIPFAVKMHLKCSYKEFCA